MSQVTDGARRIRDPQPFNLSGGVVEVIGLAEFYRYLGVQLGYQQTPRGTVLAQAVERIENLFRSDLAPHQKLLALKRFELPRLSFLLRLVRFPQSELRRVDRNVRRCVRIAYCLPMSTEAAVVIAERTQTSRLRGGHHHHLDPRPLLRSVSRHNANPAKSARSHSQLPPACKCTVERGVGQTSRSR